MLLGKLPPPELWNAALDETLGDLDRIKHDLESYRVVHGSANAIGPGHVKMLEKLNVKMAEAWRILND
jgi:hypothetical protein